MVETGIDWIWRSEGMGKMSCV